MSSRKSMGLPTKIFAGTVSGLSISMVVCSVLYLFWFIPFNRPGHRVASVQEIIVEQQKLGSAEARTDAQLQTDAESIHSFRTLTANFLYKPFEFLLLTSTCLIAAYFAALYGFYHDKGEGRPLGSLALPTAVGTVIGAVVLWGALSMLVVSDGHASQAVKHRTAAAEGSTVSADPNHKAPASANDSHDHHAHSADHASGAHESPDWRFEYWNYARMIAYFIGTIAAAVVGVVAPRGSLPRPKLTPMRPAHG